MLCALFLAWLCGCATVPKDERARWNELFSAPATQAAAAPETSDAVYDLERVAEDFARLAALVNELDAIDVEAARLLQVLGSQGRSYFTSSETDSVAFLIFRFRVAAVALNELGDFFLQRRGETPEAHARGIVLALTSVFNWSYHRARLVALTMKQKDLVKLANAEYPRYEIPGGTYDETFRQVTSMQEMKRLQLSWEIFNREQVKPHSWLLRLRESDAEYAELIDGLADLYADADIHMHYVVHESRHSLADVHNYLRHSYTARLAGAVGDAFGQDMYAAQGALFKNVARIKRPATRLTEFSEEDVHKIQEILRPGDVILTYTSGYMSNLFLPGRFKHGITYIGTPAQRREAGLTAELLEREAISEEQLGSLRESVARDRTSSEHAADVIEAVAEGVVMNCLEELMATHINRMLVLRPVISDEERAAQLVSLFRYLGMPYDFNFDFTDNSYQCCTELVYRTLNGKGTIDLRFGRIRGKWVLTADDMVNYYLRNNSAAFELVLFCDSSEKEPRATLLTGEAAMAPLRRLMGMPYQVASD